MYLLVCRLKEKSSKILTNSDKMIVGEESDCRTRYHLKNKASKGIFAAAKSQGLNVKLRGNNLIIDDIKYSYKDIDSLPHGLTMESVKILIVTDGLAFQSHHAYLSNMFPCIIKVNDVIFKSAEHYYSAEMARYHNRLDLIQPIIDSKDGYAAKRIV